MRDGHSKKGRSGSQVQREMDEAVVDWLAAYENHKRYLSATERLFLSFARSWRGSHRYLAEAFADYREALLRECGYSPLQVAKIFSMGNSKSE
jgi:hypothetical protein